MVVRSFYRPVGSGLLLLALTACMTPEPAGAYQTASTLGVDLGSAPARTAARAEPPMVMPATTGMSQPTLPRKAADTVQMAHDGHADAHGVGTVTAVNAAQRKLGLNHEPIPSLGWPSMTMEFAVAPTVNLGVVQPGTRVNFTLEKGTDGMYVIQSVQPAGGGR